MTNELVLVRIDATEPKKKVFKRGIAKRKVLYDLMITVINIVIITTSTKTTTT